ncbi:hypothetical protein [Burkholderia vietnamiensis]|uniref:hypothetical protein n=1 Tax=Burkholderia vietnamiensis TaxID=60552 RepID=UPI0012D9BA64|nr:hypothetical protein [Burkholderia vietnamiensis]
MPSGIAAGAASRVLRISHRKTAAKGAAGSQPTSTICRRSAGIDTISIAGLRMESEYPNSPVAALKGDGEPLPDND